MNKIEIKAQGRCVITYVSRISNAWQKRSVDLSEFESGPCGEKLTTFDQVEELTFVFEPDKSGTTGLVFLDDVRFKP